MSKPAGMMSDEYPSASESDSGDLFDLQVNGFAGVDFQQPDLTVEDLERAAVALHAHRTTRILLTLITDHIDALCAQLARIEELRRRSALIRQTIVGYHLEGPYLRPEPGYHGAHPPAKMKAPDLGEFDRLWKASNGNLRLITLAPEWPGAAAFIRDVVQRGVRVAIGHSNASDAEIDAAQNAGLSLCTHLGNAVPQHMHRHDNIVQRLLARDDLFAAFIPDGLHLPPTVLQNFVRAKPVDRVLFTTDAMAAAAAKPGRYTLGELEVEVAVDGIVREPGRQNFAGSSLTMDLAFRNVENLLGWSVELARTACGSRVAQYLGFPD